MAQTFVLNLSKDEPRAVALPRTKEKEDRRGGSEGLAVTIPIGAAREMKLRKGEVRLMAKFDRNRLMFGAMLLAAIAVGEIVLHELHLPAWPVFFIMVFFFLAHMDKKVAPNIIIGALAGIGCMVMARPIVTAIAPFTGAAMGRLIYILTIVAAIILFREMVPMVFNDYFFAYFLVSGLAAKASFPPRPYTWMAVTLVGGTLLICAVLGMRKLVARAARKRAVTAARAARLVKNPE